MNNREIIKIEIQCSRCGVKRELSNEKMQNTIDAIKDGWDSFGGALYCPDCTADWDSRNPGRTLAGERNTFWVIANKFIDSE